MKRPLICSTILAHALVPLCSAQLGRIPGLNRDSKEEKERKQKEKEQAAIDKNASRYLKLKNYSVNKYQSDVEFRDDVYSLHWSAVKSRLAGILLIENIRIYRVRELELEAISDHDLHFPKLPMSFSIS